jgi:hypothetical protein
MGAGAVGMTIAKACACCCQLRSDDRSVRHPIPVRSQATRSQEDTAKSGERSTTYYRQA